MMLGELQKGGKYQYIPSKTYDIVGIVLIKSNWNIV